MMRFSRITSLIFALSLAGLALCVVSNSTPAAWAQTNISGDITGTIVDQSGAALPNAQVTANSLETGATTTTTTNSTGGYRFSLVKPGNYTITASAKGFKTSSTRVTVAVGQSVTQNLQLALGPATETVEVTAASQLLQTDTAQLSTQVNREQIQNIPNPGSDITYIAQSRPGVVMNTGANSATGALGFGNFSAFGLPGTSNNFTTNGMQVNDPFLNLNNSGPSNLLLGLNDVQESDVVTNAYEAEYGGFGGVQLNSITRSGSDKFHGNFNYAWNGSVMNANNWLNKASTPQVARPFSNFNQWAGAVGGPIKRGKVFFFVNTEGISFITSSQSVIFLPSSSFISSVVGPAGNCATGSLAAAGQASQCAFYTHMFGIYTATKNYASAVPTSTPGQLRLSQPSKLNLTENLITGRIDANLTPHDKIFGHFSYDHGVQPTYTDPISPIFNASSDQPDYQGQFAWTRTIGTHMVNQFLMTGSWYSAIFKNVNPAVELATFPFSMNWTDGFLTNLNNIGFDWPQGRNVTQAQVGDDFSYTKGKHTIKVGFMAKKNWVSDFDTGIFTTPLVSVSQPGFITGVSDSATQVITTSLNNPLQIYSIGAYAQDNWKPVPNATLMLGVRFERNGNPSCSRNCLSNFGGDFFTLASTSPLNSAALPFNQQIRFGLKDSFTNYQAYMFEPRIGFTYSPNNKTVIRGGFGMFTDVFPGTIADTLLTNPPLTTTWAVSTPSILNPTSPQSAQALMAGANQTFTSQFLPGNPNTPCPASFAPGAMTGSLGSANCMAAANSNFITPSFTTVAAKIRYPTYEEWNLQIQHQFAASQSIQIGYVGNHGYHEPNQNVGVNAFGGIVPTGLPATAPAPAFANVTQIESNASSNYNGVIVSWLMQGHGVNMQWNYAYSRALDMISNGGILPFNAATTVPGTPPPQFNPHNIAQNYGNADYDVRNYFSGNYLYQIPHYGGPAVLTGGWQFGGTIFYNSGTPFTPFTHVSNFGISNYGIGINPVPIVPAAGTNFHCGNNNAIVPCLTSGSTGNFPAYFPNGATSITPTVPPYGIIGRNQFWGPHFFDMDMTMLKGFKIPKLGEQGKLQLGATAYNMLNHPNHGTPDGVLDDSTFGLSLFMQGPPTSIYGSGLGGDPSVRILEVTGRIIF